MKSIVRKFNGTLDDSSLEYLDALQFKIKLAGYSTGVLSLCDGVSAPLFGGVGVRVRVLSNGYVRENGVNVGQEYTIVANKSSEILPVNGNEYTEFLLFGLDKITRLWNSYITEYFTIRDPRKLYYCDSNALLWSNEGITCIFFAPSGNETIEGDDIERIFPAGMNKAQVKTFRFTGFENGRTIPAYKFPVAILAEFTSIEAISVYLHPTGDIAVLSGLTHVKEFQARAEAFGNIVSLGAMTSLTYLNVNDSNITGSIEDFVAAQYDAGRTSGTVRWNSTGISWQGTVQSLQNKDVSWTDRTTITVTNHS